MKLVNGTTPQASVIDYSTALRQALAWLGDRYLLATPVRALRIQRRSPYLAAGALWQVREPARRTS